MLLSLTSITTFTFPRKMPRLHIILAFLLFFPLTLAQFNFFPFAQNPFGGQQQQQQQQQHSQSSGSRAHKGWAEYEAGMSSLSTKHHMQFYDTLVIGADEILVG